MNHRLMLLALTTAVFAAAWSTDQCPLSDSGSHGLAEVGERRTPIAALMQPHRNPGAYWEQLESPYGLDWMHRAGRESSVWGEAEFGWQEDVWCSGLPRSATPPDYWRFGCGRFEDGSPAETSSTKVTLQLKSSNNSASNASSTTAIDTPLPCGMVPGTYAVVGRQGQVRTLVVTERLLADRGNLQRWPAGYYVHSSAQGTWHYIRIERPGDGLRAQRQFAKDAALLWHMCGHAGQRVLGPMATLPMAMFPRDADSAEASVAIGWLLQVLSTRRRESMAQEFQESQDRIDWSSRIAEQRSRRVHR